MVKIKGKIISYCEEEDFVCIVIDPERKIAINPTAHYELNSIEIL